MSNSRTISIIGGGPGGLYLALLLKRRAPRWRVTVSEAVPAAETFGFGVGFSAATLRSLAAADVDSHAAILSAAHPGSRAEFRVAGGVAAIATQGAVAIERATLLRLLAERAEQAGVRLQHGRLAEVEDAGDADAIVAADGAGSPIRQRLADQLGATVETADGLYLWCGADVELPASLYATAETEHGVFVTHAYPYGGGRSTFLVEADKTTWRRAGLDRAAEQTPAGATDGESLRYIEAAFAPLLSGAALIGNRTQWRRFRTVRARRWHHDRVVLLGDAAHTAHYSVGSGTKMAMEDAIALADALTAETAVGDAFRRYERARRPAVERLQRIAAASQAWWETFPRRSHLPAGQLALAFLTRTGSIGLRDVEARDPEVLSAAAAAFGAAAPTREAILATPLRRDGRSLPSRVVGDDDDAYVEVDGPAAAVEARARRPQAIVARVLDVDVPADPDAGAAVVARARALHADGCDAVRLRAPRGATDGVRALLELAERVRLETGALAVVAGDRQDADDLVAGLAAGRVDLVALRP